MKMFQISRRGKILGTIKAGEAVLNSSLRAALAAMVQPQQVSTIERSVVSRYTDGVIIVLPKDRRGGTLPGIHCVPYDFNPGEPVMKT